MGVEAAFKLHQELFEQNFFFQSCFRTGQEQFVKNLALMLEFEVQTVNCNLHVYKGPALKDIYFVPGGRWAVQVNVQADNQVGSSQRTSKEFEQQKSEGAAARLQRLVSGKKMNQGKVYEQPFHEWMMVGLVPLPKSGDVADADNLIPESDCPLTIIEANVDLVKLPLKAMQNLNKLFPDSVTALRNGVISYLQSPPKRRAGNDAGLRGAQRRASMASAAKVKLARE